MPLYSFSLKMETAKVVFIFYIQIHFCLNWKWILSIKTQPNQFFGSGSYKKQKMNTKNTIFFLLTKQALNFILQLLDIYRRVQWTRNNTTWAMIIRTKPNFESRGDKLNVNLSNFIMFINILISFPPIYKGILHLFIFNVTCLTSIKMREN